jgi:hypothetical protein
MHTDSLQTRLKSLEKLLKDTENVAKKYVSITSKAKPEQIEDETKNVIQFDEPLYNRLMKVYNEAKSLLVKDEAAVDGCFEKLNEIQKPVNGKRKGKDPESPPGKKQKRFKKEIKSASPPIPEISETYICSTGDLVAARAPGSDDWILAKVTGYNPKTQRYEVEDFAPEEEDAFAKKFQAGHNSVIPLPPDSSLAPPSPSPGSLHGPRVYLYHPIPAKTPVLAMFPNTTTFYPAKVVSSHKKNKVVMFYHLQFDDDHEDGFTPSRKVNAQFVIPYPGVQY